MSEDRLLHELGDFEREESGTEKARLDERWDRMAAGTLTAEEEAELRAFAETSPEARETYEAFRPLGPDFQARIIDTIAAELTQPQAKPEPQQPPPRILPFRQATVRYAGWLTTAAAAAASLFLLLRPMPPLPAYIAEKPAGGVQMFRGEEDPSSKQPLFIPGSTIKLVVRPQRPVTGPVEARGFLSPQTGKADLALWKPEPNFEIDHGAVRLRGTLGKEIQLSPGAWTVWIVVGRKFRIPSASELQSELLAGRTQHSDWQAVCEALRTRQTTSNRPWQPACANLRVEDQPP